MVSKYLLVFLCFLVSLKGFSQNGVVSDTIELEGKIKQYLISKGSFSFGRFILETESKPYEILFSPTVGKKLIERFPERSVAKVSVTRRLRNGELINYPEDFPISAINLLSIKNQNYTLNDSPSFKWGLGNKAKKYKPLLDLKIEDIYYDDKYSRAFILENGEIIHISRFFQRFLKKELEEVKIGSVISSFSYAYLIEEGQAFPIEFEELYNYNPLVKSKGRIKSLLHKQNFAYIGLVLDTEEGEKHLSFSSDFGEKIRKLSKKNEVITIYHKAQGRSFNDEFTPLYVICSRQDTIIMNRLFEGEEQVERENSKVSYSGKIKEVTKNKSGRIITLLTGDAIIEGPPAKLEQMERLLKKGKQIEIEGMEYLRAEGEAYYKELRNIVASKITIDGKTFILN